jgi:hypothetical protein
MAPNHTHPECALLTDYEIAYISHVQDPLREPSAIET